MFSFLPGYIYPCSIYTSLSIHSRLEASWAHIRLITLSPIVLLSFTTVQTARGGDCLPPTSSTVHLLFGWLLLNSPNFQNWCKVSDFDIQILFTVLKKKVHVTISWWYFPPISTRIRDWLPAWLPPIRPVWTEKAGRLYLYYIGESFSRLNRLLLLLLLTSSSFYCRDPRPQAVSLHWSHSYCHHLSSSTGRGDFSYRSYSDLAS